MCCVWSCCAAVLLRCCAVGCMLDRGAGGDVDMFAAAAVLGWMQVGGRADRGAGQGREGSFDLMD